MKYRLQIEETLVYDRFMEVELPKGMSDSVFETILDNAERRTDAAEDLPYILGDYDIETVKYPDSDLRGPRGAEVEIIDVVPAKEVD